MKEASLDFYASKMQESMDKYWEKNNMDEKDLHAILNEHLRTPYPQGK